MLPVVFITDNGYFMPTMVAIQSIIQNRKGDIAINVIGIKLSNSNKEYIIDYSNKQPSQVAVKYIETDFSEFEQFHTAEDQYVSPTALVKFKLSNIFKEYEKLLYIDGDVIVRGSLKELDDIDLGNHYAGVVKDLMSLHQGDPERIGRKSYFNSGVLLLNCKKIRDDNLYQKLINEKKTIQASTIWIRTYSMLYFRIMYYI